MPTDKTSTNATARRVADPKLKTLSGHDNEEAMRELRERLNGIEPFRSDEAFFAYARARWEAKQ